MIIIGIDEVGRGCIAGPVVACSCVFDVNDIDDDILELITDSKKISKKKREFIYDSLKNVVNHSIAEVSVEVIDEINILNATMHAMVESYNQLKIDNKQNVKVIVDGNKMPELINNNAEAVVKADAKFKQVALASIFAKVYRDRLMHNYASLFPEYGFENHAGYGTAAHIDAVKIYGVLPIHRKSFEPIKTILSTISLDS